MSRRIALAVLAVVALAVALTQIEIEKAGACPSSGAGFCALEHLEPLGQWLIEQLRGMF